MSPVPPENQGDKEKTRAQNLSAGGKEWDQDRGQHGFKRTSKSKPGNPPPAAQPNATKPITKADGLTEVFRITPSERAELKRLAAEESYQRWDNGKSVRQEQFNAFCQNFTSELKRKYPNMTIHALGQTRFTVKDDDGTVLATIIYNGEKHIRVKGPIWVIDTLQSMAAERDLTVPQAEAAQKPKTAKIRQPETAINKEHTSPMPLRAAIMPLPLPASAVVERGGKPAEAPRRVQLHSISTTNVSHTTQDSKGAVRASPQPSTEASAALTQRLSTVAGEQRDRAKSGTSVAASGPERTLTLTANSQQEARKKAGTIPVQSAELSLVSAGPDSPKPPKTSQPMQDPKFEEFCKKLADAYDGALPDAKKINRVTADNALHITQPPPPWSIHQLQNGERQIKVPNDDTAAERIIRSAIEAKPANSPLVINLDNPKHIELAVKCAQEKNIPYTLGEAAQQAQKQEASKRVQPR